jgi:hypothetical protein
MDRAWPIDRQMNDRPLYQFWPIFIGVPMFLGFAVYNLYSAYIYGGLIGSQYGSGWVTLSERPYTFWFAVTIYILIVLTFGGGFIKVMQYFVLRTRYARRK